MSKAAQLKKKAAEFEQKKQYDRALATYVQAIDAAAGNPDEVDIPLYNRVGDLYFRLGDVDKALTFYEKAVDLYTEGGFFNNAIALCNKVLRHAPSRSTIYYKLGRISAKKGFNSDAKQNFLEYADRMQKAGKVDEAFRALKEFADLCPGQDDVRLMLAEQLSRAGRKDEALEQLQIVHSAMLAEDRGREAAATLERIRAIDPSFEPKESGARQTQKRDGLVFLDVEGGDFAPSAPSVAPVDGLEPTTYAEVETPVPPPAALGFEPTALEPEPEVEEPAAEDPEVHEPQDEATEATEATEPAGLTLLEPELEPEMAPEPEPVSAETPAHDRDDVFVDLSEWLADTPAASGADNEFGAMLETFKRGVAEHVEEGDSESQYDLGLAYMEMGLLTEAVAQFERAIAGDAPPERRVRAYESLAQCYVQSGETDRAEAVLQRAEAELSLPDDKLIGVVYLLGNVAETQGHWDDARRYYARVAEADPGFRDVDDRLQHAVRASASA